MFTQKDVDILNNELPTSAVMEIHKKTAISRPTIYRFLHGLKVRSSIQDRIYIAALEVIEQDKIITRSIKRERARILQEPAD